MSARFIDCDHVGEIKPASLRSATDSVARSVPARCEIPRVAEAFDGREHPSLEQYLPHFRD